MPFTKDARGASAPAPGKAISATRANGANGGATAATDGLPHVGWQAKLVKLVG